MRTGKVIAASYADYSYKGQKGNDIHRFNVQIQLPDQTVVSGVYDSISLDQKKMVVGQDVDFDTEERQKANGEKFLKLKPAAKIFGGAKEKESPEVRAQIQRSSCLKRIPEIIEGFKKTDPEQVIIPGALVIELNSWVVAIGQGTKQRSINAQASLESACKMILHENIKTVNELLELAHKYFNYIMG